jgi:hypothetical protein
MWYIYLRIYTLNSKNSAEELSRCPALLNVSSKRPWSHAVKNARNTAWLAPGREQMSQPRRYVPMSAQSSTGVRKVIGRPFQPGRSGNPGGKPKALHELIELCRQHTPAVIKRLSEIVKNGEERAAVAAAKELLDRGYGKAKQVVEVSRQDVKTMSDEELREKAREVIAKYATEQPAAAGVGPLH